MAFPINTLIPAANNNPSNDQPLMQANFFNTAGFLAVDHVAPGTNSQDGQHNQIRFAINQSGAPLASAVLELFCNSTLGVSGTESTLFLENAARVIRLSNLNLYFSGSDYGIETPWGLIFNFGSATTVGGTVIVTYALPFTTATYSIQCTPNSPNLHQASARATSTTQTTINSDSTNVFYFAIGK